MANLELSKITVSQMTTFNIDVPFANVATLPTAIAALNHNLTRRVPAASVQTFLHSVQLIMDTPGEVLRQCHTYMEIASGESVLGAVAIIARVGDTNVAFTVRCIEARHQTPQQYTYWTERVGRHHPWGGGVHDVTRSSPRALTADEVKAIQTALTAALHGQQQLLLAN